MTAAVQHHPADHPADEREAHARTLVRRQLVLSIATFVLVGGALALLRWHALEAGGTHYARVVQHGQSQVQIVHDEPGAFVMRLAVVQLVLCGAVALVAVAHAARVIAFVFPRASRSTVPREVR